MGLNSAVELIQYGPSFVCYLDQHPSPIIGVFSSRHPTPLDKGGYGSGHRWQSDSLAGS